MKSVKSGIAFLALASSAALAAPAAAGPTVTSITLHNAIGQVLQVAEVQAFSGGVDVALGGSAYGSSTYSSFSTPDKAIDGNIGGDYYADGIFHSATSSPGEFLNVVLPHAFDLSSLTVFGRTDDGFGFRDVYDYSLFDGDVVVGSGRLDARDGPASASFPDVQAAVPEPATWAMMLLGMGAVGYALRARRRGAATAIA